MVFDKYRLLKEQVAGSRVAQPLSAGSEDAEQDLARVLEGIERAKAKASETARVGQVLQVASTTTSVFSQENRAPFFLAGSAQVTEVSDKLSDTSEASDILSDTLAGVPPHAPGPLLRKRKIGKNSKGCKFSFRMPYVMKAKLEAKAAAVESYPSAYVLQLVAADLCLPLDEGKAIRSYRLQDQIAALTLALNKQGGLFNQIAAALNRGQPCPVTRQEIESAWGRHIAATNAIVKLGFD